MFLSCFDPEVDSKPSVETETMKVLEAWLGHKPSGQVLVQTFVAKLSMSGFTISSVPSAAPRFRFVTSVTFSGSSPNPVLEVSWYLGASHRQFQTSKILGLPQRAYDQTVAAWNGRPELAVLSVLPEVLRCHGSPWIGEKCHEGFTPGRENTAAAKLMSHFLAFKRSHILAPPTFQISRHKNGRHPPTPVTSSASARPD